MTFSYTCKPNSKKLDEIRFLISDKDEGTRLIEDEELEYLMLHFGDNVTIENCNVNAVCAAAMDAMASNWAKKQSIKASNYTSETDSVYKKLISRAERFRQNAVTSEHFLAPSISVSDKADNESDTDTPKPSFKRNIFDNPQAPADPYDESTTLT